MTATPREQAGSAAAQTEFAAAIVRKVSWRLIPFMALLYFVNYLDRVNVSFAALTMNQDLGFSPEVYGNGAGILFLGYFLFQVPSNVALHRYGTRAVIMPIMIVWGLVSTAMAFVSGPTSFYALRFLLGAAEAGFFPGMILYLTYWFPASQRGRIAGAFLLALPLSSVLGAPVSTVLLGIQALGLQGWQWLFILQGVPAVLLGFLALGLLTDRPAPASWLTEPEKAWLAAELAKEHRADDPAQRSGLKEAVLDIRVWTFALIYFSTVFGFYGITFWLPQILKSFGGMTNLQVGFLTAVPYLIAVPAMYYWGAHSDRTGERAWHVAIPAFAAGIGFAASAIFGDVPAAAFVALAVAAASIYSVIPVFWTLPTRVLAGLAAAGGIALINAFGNLSGYFGPALVGYVRQTTGSYAYGLLTLSGFAMLAGVLTLLVGRATHRPVGRISERNPRVQNPAAVACEAEQAPDLRQDGVFEQ
jgi:ACS family tartrate transporter-like MFS transporter